MKGKLSFVLLGLAVLALTTGMIGGCGRGPSPTGNGDVPQQSSAVVGEIQLEGAGRFIVFGNYAYVASDAGLYIVDVSDPTNPTLVGSAEIENFNSYDIALYSNYVYMSGYVSVSGSVVGDYIKIINVSNPANPQIVNSIDTGVHSYDLSFHGNRLYSVAAYSPLKIYNVTTPEAPSLEVSVQISWSLEDIEVSDNYAYIADYFNGLRVVCLTSIESVIEEKVVSIDKADNLFLSGNYVYLTEYGGKLHVIDVSDPASPVEINSYDGSYHYRPFVLGNYVYLPASFSLLILDVSDKQNLSVYKTVDEITYWVYAADKYIYIRGNDSTLKIIEKAKL